MTMWGFSSRFSALDPLHAELMALKTGLDELQRRQHHRVIIETDCSSVVTLLHGHASEDHPLVHLVSECKALHHSLWHCPVVYTPRVCNYVAHKLAFLSVSLCMHRPYVFLTAMPSSVTEVVMQDRLYNRA